MGAAATFPGPRSWHEREKGRSTMNGDRRRSTVDLEQLAPKHGVTHSEVTQHRRRTPPAGRSAPALTARQWGGVDAAGDDASYERVGT